MRLPLLSLLACAALCSGCWSTKAPTYKLPSGYTLEQVPRVITVAQEDIRENDDPGLAFARLNLALETTGATGQERLELERVRAGAAEALLERLRLENAPPEHFTPLVDGGLNRNLEVRSRIAQARAWLNRSERIKAYREIKKMDGLHPFHSERQASGRLLFDAGMSLAEDRGKYGIFFRFRRLAPEVLEYFTTTYYTGEWDAGIPNELSTVHPELSPRECGPLAYETLSNLYSEIGEDDLSIQRRKDLNVFYGGSVRVPSNRARIPRLRLDSIGQADHDRGPIDLARVELKAWLEDFDDQNLPEEEGVRRDLLHAYQMLADHDAIVANFYRTVKNRAGEETHLRRAVEMADQGGSPEQIDALRERLQQFLASTPPASSAVDQPEPATNS